MFFEISDLRKSFGGVKAVDGINIHVEKGQICSVIGPNGAGKTTLFNLITGQIKPDSGKVTFLGDDITHKPAKIIARRGIARSFQIVSVFPRLTVYENIMIAILGRQRRTLNLTGQARELTTYDCSEVLKTIGLSGQGHILAGELSHGNQKRLEVGLAFSMKPKLLLLDEPTSGMAAEEKAGILSTVRDMRLNHDCTVLMSEHDMSVIFSISDRIWVIHNGRVVTDGTVGEIRNNETVRKIYLGERE